MKGADVSFLVFQLRALCRTLTLFLPQWPSYSCYPAPIAVCSDRRAGNHGLSTETINSDL
ncbi:hypothetical protein J6590_071759 [Homalodisca vitripennis]|nr:hypothetical protein J6590_071759 [Homalodisca vitripennis]